MPPKRRVVRAVRRQGPSPDSAAAAAGTSDGAGAGASASASSATTARTRPLRMKRRGENLSTDPKVEVEDSEQRWGMDPRVAEKKKDPRAAPMDDDVLAILSASMASVTLDERERAAEQAAAATPGSSAAAAAAAMAAARAASFVPEITPETERTVVPESGFALPAKVHTGVVCLETDSLPEGVNKTRFFPLRPAAFKEYLATNATFYKEFLVMLPFQDVAIWTPGLMCLMRLGQTVAPTQSAFDVFREYSALFTVLSTENLVYASPENTKPRPNMVRTRRDTVTNFLWVRAVEKTINVSDLDLVEQYTLNEANEFVKLDELRAAIDAGGVKKEVIEKHLAQVYKFKRWGSEAPWHITGTCAEDVAEDVKARKLNIAESLGMKLTALGDSADTMEVYNLMFASVIECLQVYELGIMRLLSEEVSVGNQFTIPREHFSLFMTRPAHPDPVSHIHITVRPRLLYMRQTVNAARAHMMTRTAETLQAAHALVATEPERVASETDVSDCRPTESDMQQYLAFIQSLPSMLEDSDEIREMCLDALTDVFRPSTQINAEQAVAKAEAAVAKAKASASDVGIGPITDAACTHFWDVPPEEEIALSQHLQQLDAIALQVRAQKEQTTEDEERALWNQHFTDDPEDEDGTVVTSEADGKEEEEDDVIID